MITHAEVQWVLLGYTELHCNCPSMYVRYVRAPMGHLLTIEVWQCYLRAKWSKLSTCVHSRAHRERWLLLWKGEGVLGTCGYLLWGCFRLGGRELGCVHLRCHWALRQSWHWRGELCTHSTGRRRRGRRGCGHRGRRCGHRGRRRGAASGWRIGRSNHSWNILKNLYSVV